MNRRRREILAACDGLSLDHGRLCARSAADTKRLRDACAAVAATRGALPRHAGDAFPFHVRLMRVAT